MRKDISGYEGLYQVDIKGNVYSLRKNIKMKQAQHPSGYKYINLWNGNSHDKYKVHRLVGLAFIPNPDNKPQINHIDGDKENNSVENLEWATQSENMKHSFEVLKNKSSSYPGRKQKTNKHGFQGVLEKNDGRKNKFMARIRINGKFKSLGHYSTAKEAGEAYKEAAKYHQKIYQKITKRDEI